MEEEPQIRWQPVLMRIDRRLECECGALAVVVTGTVSGVHYNALDDVDVWCQACFEKAQEEL